MSCRIGIRQLLMEFLAARRQPNRCRRVSGFEFYFAEIVVRVRIRWAELNRGAKFFERSLLLSLLTQCFSEGAMYIGNLGVRLLERFEPLYARGDSTGPDH